MSEGLNKVLLLGNCAADPELRMTSGGQAVLKIRLVTNQRVKKRDGSYEDHAEWHSVIVWGRRAEGLAKILNKGSRIFIEGSLRTSSYDDRDGNKRYKTEVTADSVVLAGGERAPARQSNNTNDSHGDGNWGMNPPDDDTIPF